jgi:Uncharacterized conserved protein
MNVLISACLLGVPCRYDGKSKDTGLEEQYPQLTFVEICPEVMGGLSTPRRPAEISGDRVVTIDGDDVTREFANGAQKTLEVARANDCAVAILKARSPSCGSGLAYDGTFSGKLVTGDGVLTALLKENGIAVFSEENLNEFEAFLKEK